MPVASIARAIKPPSASISRTRCPLAVPPTAGLHGMCATVSRDRVHSPTLQPSRAAANAASTPACPAPITITSKRHHGCDADRGLHVHLTDLFPYAELLEDMPQHVLRRASSDNLVEACARCLQVCENKFLRRLVVHRPRSARAPGSRARVRAAPRAECSRWRLHRAAIPHPSTPSRSRVAGRPVLRPFSPIP